MSRPDDQGPTEPDLDEHERALLGDLEAQPGDELAELLASLQAMPERRKIWVIAYSGGKIDLTLEFRASPGGAALVTLPLSVQGQASVWIQKDRWYRKKSHTGLVGTYVTVVPQPLPFRRLRLRTVPDAGVIHRIGPPFIDYHGWLNGFEVDKTVLWMKWNSPQVTKLRITSQAPDGTAWRHAEDMQLARGRQEVEWIIPKGKQWRP